MMKLRTYQIIAAGLLGITYEFLIILRKILITIWFWLGVCLGAILAGAFSILFQIVNIFTKQQGWGEIMSSHDFITLCIEFFMADLIYYWMTVPRIWKVTEYSSTKIDNINKLLRKNYVLASNHTSIIDTMFMATFPFKKTYTYNKKWSKIPVFGWLCLWADYVGITPENKSRIVEMTVDKVKQGYSVMIYPEGTRSKTPWILQELKTGAFRVAKDADVKVMPIVFHGCSDAVNRYGIADIAHVKIAFLMPFEVEDVKEGVEKFRRTVNSFITDLDNK